MTKQYIEREAAKRELLSWAVSINHPEYLIKDDALHIIDSIPAADVVEVVRYGKCKHFRPYEGEEYKGDCAELVGLENYVYEDDFCSYGKRKGGAD